MLSSIRVLRSDTINWALYNSTWREFSTQFLSCNLSGKRNLFRFQNHKVLLAHKRKSLRTFSCNISNKYWGESRNRLYNVIIWNMCNRNCAATITECSRSDLRLKSRNERLEGGIKMTANFNFTPFCLFV